MSTDWHLQPDWSPSWRAARKLAVGRLLGGRYQGGTVESHLLLIYWGLAHSCLLPSVCCLCLLPWSASQKSLLITKIFVPRKFCLEQAGVLVCWSAGRVYLLSISVSLMLHLSLPPGQAGLETFNFCSIYVLLWSASQIEQTENIELWIII